MSTEELVKYGVHSGLKEFFSRTDLVLPEWKVINKASAKISSELVSEKWGQFINLATNEVKPEINAVLLKYSKGSMYNTGKFPNTTLVCYTRNFFTPTHTTPVSNVCRKYALSKSGGRVIDGVCEKACWVTDDAGKKHSPLCRENDSFIVYDLDTDMLAQLTLKGANLYTNSPLKKFISHVMTTGKELYCFGVKLGTIKASKVYPTMSSADEFSLVTFNDVTFRSEDWRDFMEKSAALSNVNVVTDEIKASTDSDVIDSDDLPF